MFANGYVKLMKYGELKKNIPPKLEISPVAMIPHILRSYGTILDLSFCLRSKETLTQSVNLATVNQTQSGAMIQLSQ